jgi:putative NADH-flavin reductase
MRITVFGATGNVGSRVVTEARSRGHEVTAVTRRPTPGTRTGDAADIDDVIALSAGQDLVISATRPGSGRESELVTTTRTLLAGLGRTGVRLLLVGGSATLTDPGTGIRTVDAPDYPAAWRPIGLACADQLDVCRADTGADWAYASPPALIEPGNRTGRYRLGADELVVDADGISAISMEDFAVALLDEAERPKHHRTRFTVGW